MTSPAPATLQPAHPAAIAWIDVPAPAGRWGHPDALAVPLSDRGLLLADGLFETVLVLDGRPRLLAHHLARWHAGASLMGLAPPPDGQQVEALVGEAIARSGIRSGALRLNWSRGSPGTPGARGIAIPDRCHHRFWLQLSPASPCFEPVRVIVSPSETRSATSLLSRCKTFAYGSAIQARRQAEAAGADDALLPSDGGGLCCGTSANLLVRRGDTWLTPPAASGCLPGVMRARALDLGLAVEEWLERRDLAACSGAVLLNSLGCRPIGRLEGESLPWQLKGWDPLPAERDQGRENSPASAMARGAEALWRRLLGA